MPFPTIPSAAADREDEQARRHPERATLELATAGAAQVLGVDHGVTQALARASTTMAKADLWHARLAVKTLRRDQREAIAAASTRPSCSPAPLRRPIGLPPRVKRPRATSPVPLPPRLTGGSARGAPGNRASQA